MRVLITGGGCEEPIDGVRSVCNFSTGRTAAFLADRFYEKGLAVTAVTAARAARPEHPVVVHTFRTFAELSDTVHSLLGKHPFDLVIHAAAVSDFSVGSVILNGKEYAPGSLAKIESGSSFSVNMKENPKILDSLKTWSKNEKCRVVAFKLTNEASLGEREQAVAALFGRTGATNRPDLVVSNDLSEITADAHPFRIYALKAHDVADTPDRENVIVCLAEGRTKQELADFIGGLS